MASVTFNTTASEDAALVAAFGWYLNLGRNATAAEIKAATSQYWRGVVQQYQTQQAAAGAAITPINPT
jgi:hypothetical protein